MADHIIRAAWVKITVGFSILLHLQAYEYSKYVLVDHRTLLTLPTPSALNSLWSNSFSPPALLALLQFFRITSSLSNLLHCLVCKISSEENFK